MEVVRAADVTVVVLVPGTGDEVQALKAGIMEIADIFVVNKADREGADRLVSAIETNLSLQPFGPDEWRPPIVKTVATGGVGVDELWRTVTAFRGRKTSPTADRRRRRSEQRVRELVTERLVNQVLRILPPEEWDATVDRVATGELDPYSAADALVARAIERVVRP